MKKSGRKFGLWVLLALIPLMGAVAAADEDKTADANPSKITAVTVYVDRAEVTREARVLLKSGEVEVSFGGLPAALDNNSMQVWGAGQAAAMLEGVTVEREPAPEVPEGKVAELESRIEGLRDRKNILLDNRTAIKARIKMLSDVRPTGPRSDENISWGRIEEFEQIALSMVNGLREAYAEQRALEAEIRKISKEISALNRELRKVRNPSRGRTKMVKINLNVTRPGNLTITFSYMLRGARWAPLYDIRALPDKGQVEITGHAEIVQRTGEDWTDVSLSVSTAKPHIGGTPPTLNPIYLKFYYPRREGRRRPAMATTGAAAPEAEPMESLADDMDMESAEEEIAEAEVSTAAVKQTGTAVFFEVKQKKSIPSDGEPHRVSLMVDKLDAEFEHASWPEAKALAFLRAKTKNTTEHPFVAGKANVFVGSSFIGTTYLDDWSVTEEKTISLGVDQGIRVERKNVKRDEDETSSKREITYEYKIVVNNFKKKTVKIEIFDRLPISRHDDIVIKTIDVDPQPAETKDTGILKWRITLAPGEKTELRFSYSVRFPRNRRVTGLR